jgi:WD40 repeat protein
MTLRCPDGPVTAALFSPDGRGVLTLSWSPPKTTLRVWDAENGRALFATPVTTPVRSVSFSADGRRVAPPVTDPVLSVAFSPDGRRLLGIGFSRLTLWEAATGNELASHQGADYAPGPVFFDGRQVISPGSRALGRWDPATGSRLAAVRIPGVSGLHMAMSPDHRLIVSTPGGKVAHVWEAATGKEFLTLTGHQDSILAVAFSPDGRWAATASADGTARLWPIDPLAVARERRPRELTAPERERFEIRPADD